MHSSRRRKLFIGGKTRCSNCDGAINDRKKNIVDHLGCLEVELDGDGTYECPACGKAADKKSQIYWHVWVDHWENMGVSGSCPSCGDSLGFADVPQHLQCMSEADPHTVMRLVAPRERTCFVCGYTGNNQMDLGHHIKKEHLGDSLPDTCPDCGDDLTTVNGRRLEPHYLSLTRYTGLDYTAFSNSNKISCPACLERIKGRHVKRHLHENHMDIITVSGDCDVCNRSIQDVSHVGCIATLGTQQADNKVAPPDVSQISLPKATITAENQPDSTVREYRSALRRFVKLERQEQKDEAWNLYRETDLHQLKYHHNCILDLIPVGKRQNPNVDVQYVFTRPEKHYEDDPDPLTERFGIYPRQEVILGSSASSDVLPIEASVTFTDDQTIGISPKQDNISWNAIHSALTNDAATFHAVHLLNPKPFERELDAVTTITNQRQCKKILQGTARLTESGFANAGNYAGKLNGSQKRAVDRALSADDVFCIHGPPGTGKTRTLTALIEMAVARGDRVLACAHSNPATDNLLAGSSAPDTPDPDSLHATIQETDWTLSRVGYHSENDVVIRNYAHVSPEEADIVVSTTNAAAELPADEFDLVVVDEATQASQPATFVPWNKGETLVLAGDHRQLPPYCSSETAKDAEMHISLFERLLRIYGYDIAERLDQQYRMNATIADFANDAFYETPLAHGAENADAQIDNLEPMIGLNVAGSESQTGRTASKYNPEEARIVVRSVKHTISKGVPPEDIGVITPYTAQISEIWDKLDGLDIEGTDSIKVDTIDSFQGSERDVIILSFVRSNKHNSSGFLAFPEEGPLRLNVAITRAKRRLVLIGDWDTLCTVADHREPAESCANVYEELRDYLEERDCLRAVSVSAH
jgi:hypothetical protein